MIEQRDRICMGTLFPPNVCVHKVYPVCPVPGCRAQKANPRILFNSERTAYSPIHRRLDPKGGLSSLSSPPQGVLRGTAHGNHINIVFFMKNRNLSEKMFAAMERGRTVLDEFRC